MLTIAIVKIVVTQELHTPSAAVHHPHGEDHAHHGDDRFLDHLIALVVVGLQVVDLDHIVLPLLHPLKVRVVPEDGDRAPRIQGQALMSRDLDKLSGLHRLLAAGLEVEDPQGAGYHGRVAHTARVRERVKL